MAANRYETIRARAHDPAPVRAAAAFPLRLKVAITVPVAFLLPLYGQQAPAGGGIWFFDAALVVALAALWIEARLLASMTALAVLLPAAVWNLGFFGRLLGGADPFGLATAAFDPAAGWAAPAVAAVHVGLPALLAWMLRRLGYDPRALRAQTLLAWIVLALAYALAPTPAGDVFWTLGAGDNLRHAWLPGALWLLAAMLAYPVLVYLPAHLALRAVFGAPAVPAGAASQARPRARALLPRFALLRRRR